MPISALLILVLRLGLAPLVWLALTNPAPLAAIGDEEFFISCAAVYSILEHIHEGLEDDQKARIANERFHILGTEVESLFPNTDQGKSDARNRVAIRLDETLRAAAADPSFMRTAEIICDSGYMEFRNRDGNIAN